LERRARYVDWDDVTSWDGNRVYLAKRRDDLRHLGERAQDR
jgi:hypothetical protein